MRTKNTNFPMQGINLFVTSCLCLLFSAYALAQPPNFATKHLPPSPNAASLITFAETPVSYSQGTVNINIPIINYTSEKLSVPISLSYASGGIKTVQDASIVGLGWALNAGGVISRNVLGRTDEFAVLGFQNNNFDPNIQDDIDNAILLEWDLMPDIYYYNFLGRTGKFILDEDGYKVLEEESDLNFSFDNGIWKIVDEQGTIYEFAYTEGGVFDSASCGMTIDAIDDSSWYLTKITSHDSSDVINLTYQNYGKTTLSSALSETYFDPSSGGCCQGLEDFNSCSTITETENVVLQSIEGTKFKVEFYNSTRLDLVNARKIDSIKLIDIASNSDLKTYQLEYGYYSNDERLKLLEVQEFGSENEPIPPYQFTYDNNTLKSKDSKSVDHWGFQSNNTGSLLPEIDLQFGSGQDFGNESREPDENSLNGLLERIDYPTGWYEEFEYELNGYGKIIANQISPNAILQSAVVSCDGTPSCTSAATFTVENGFNTVNIVLAPVGLCQMTGDCGEFVNILDSSNNVIWTRPIEEPVDIALTFSPGTYSIEVSNDQEPDVTGSFSVFYYNSSTDPIIERTCGGARIKSIENPDGLRTYSYQTDGYSSGILLDDIKYSYSTSRFTDCDSINCGALCTGTFYSSNKTNSSHSSSHIYYTHVEETLADNSKVIYKFDYEINTANSTTFPYVPGTNRDALRGQLLEKSSYAYDGPNNYRLVESVKTEYLHSELNEVSAYNVGSLNPVCLNGQYNSYTHTNYWKRKISETQTIYDSSSGQDSVETTKYYAYDPQMNHIQITSDSLINSDDTYLLNKYYYHYDYDLNSTVKDKLEENNLLLPPFKTENYRNTELVNGNYVEMMIVGSSAQPSKEFNYEVTWENGTITPGVWDLQVEYSNYLANVGKPQTITYNHWDPIAISWTTTGKINQWTFNNFTESYVYDPIIDLLKTKTNVDGTTNSFNYDQFQRLKSTTQDCKNVVQLFDYHYSTGPNDPNYVKTKINYPIINDSELDSVVTINYYDGLFREIQTVRKFQHPNATSIDIITAKEYDQRGRLIKEFEPFNAIGNNGSYFTANPTSSYTLHEYFDEPINRIKATTLPNWHANQYNYGNASLLNDFIVDYKNNFTYAQDELICHEVIDPNGNKNIECKDKIGQIVYTGTADENQTNIISTHYSYDYKGRNILIAPPGTSINSDPLFFKYEYYPNNNLKVKKIPDQAEVNYVYNKRSLLAYWQDGNLLADDDWVATKYDNIGRVVEEGFFNGTPSTNESFSDANISNIQSQISYGVSGISKDKIVQSISSIQNDNQQIVSDFSYDDCGRVEIQEMNSILNNISSSCRDTFSYDGADNLTKQNRFYDYINDTLTLENRNKYDHVGRYVEEYIKVNSEPEYHLSKTTYNQKELIERLQLGSTTNDYLQSIDYTYLENRFLKEINKETLGDDLFYMELYYDEPFISGGGNQSFTSSARFNGDISGVTWKYLEEGSAFEKLEVYDYSYDYQNRITKGEYRRVINNTSTLLNRYSTEYSYDQRGNILSLDRSGQYLLDDEPEYGEIDKLTYNYTQTTNKIETIHDAANTKEKPFGYNGTELAYQYDTNGNIIYDPSIDATISYNYLNLPDSIYFEDGKKYKYLYDFAGTLHRKTEYLNDTIVSYRDYLNGVEFYNSDIDFIHHNNGYIQNGSTCVSDSILVLNGNETINKTYLAHEVISDKIINPADSINYFAEDTICLISGFEVPLGNMYKAEIKEYDCDTIAPQWDYFFGIKDHLGNTRLSFNDSDKDEEIAAEEIVSRHDYYAFGLEIDGDWKQQNHYVYRYNGKEKQDFGWYNYGARFYDPTIGRWTSVDPSAEKYYSWSPYNYGIDNPISFIDPDGREIKIFYQEERRKRNGDVKVNRNGETKYKTKSITYNPGDSYNGENKFVQDAFTALDHVQTDGADGGIISDLAGDKSFNVNISQSSTAFDLGEDADGNSSTSPDGKSVLFDNVHLWDFMEDKKLTGETASPALILLHELGHSYRVKHGLSLVQGVPISDPNFLDLQMQEENKVVNAIENPAAIILGDGFRSRYGGARVNRIAKNVISNE